MRLPSPVVKYLIGRSALTEYLEGDVNFESDYEGDSQGAKGETSSSGEEREAQARAVLVAGSFSAYAFFLDGFFVTGEMTIFSAGYLYSSTAVRTRSYSPPSNHRAPMLA
jgi:hypothetical protein